MNKETKQTNKQANTQTVEQTNKQTVISQQIWEKEKPNRKHGSQETHK